MRRFVSTVIIFALACAYSVAKDESVEELKGRFTNARGEERAEYGIRVAQRQLHNADALYNSGDVDKARAAVEDIASYSEKARDAAIETNKRLKNVEIEARKMADKLRDIKRTLSIDDQPPVDQAIRRLEDVRTSLLKAMFANDHKKDRK